MRNDSLLAKSSFVRFALLVMLPCCALAGPMIAAPQALHAQAAKTKTEYKVLPFDESLKRDTMIAKILRGDAEFLIDNNMEYFSKYFNTYTFAEMTLPENVNRIPELRQSFFKLVWRAKDKRAYQVLNEVTLKAMQDFVNPRSNYHPAVQYNGVLIIGDLDVEPRSLTAKQTRPIPWPGAVKTLIACATLPVFTDHVKAGALVGLVRHAEFGLTPNDRPNVIAAMLTVIEEKTPPAGRDRDAHDWLRRRACEVLGFAGQTGGKNDVPVALINAMNDPQATLAFRCSAAQALGKLQYQGALGIPTDQLSSGLGELTLAVCRDAKNRVAGADENIEKLIASQASVRLNQLKSGLAAPTAVGAPAEQSLAKDVGTQVELLLEKLQSGTGTADSLDEASRELATRLGKSGAPAASPAATTKTPATGTPTKEATPVPAEDPLGGNDF